MLPCRSEHFDTPVIGLLIFGPFSLYLQELSVGLQTPKLNATFANPHRAAGPLSLPLFRENGA